MNRKTFLLILAVAVLFMVVAIASGCSARIGPHEGGWLSWDVCGYEGGVAVEITIMQAGARLGCTNPEESNATREEATTEEGSEDE